MASEDPNGWERPTSGYTNGMRALRRAAGGRPPWESTKTGKLPPVEPYPDARARSRAQSTAEDIAERPQRDV